MSPTFQIDSHAWQWGRCGGEDWAVGRRGAGGKFQRGVFSRLRRHMPRAEAGAQILVLSGYSFSHVFALVCNKFVCLVTFLSYFVL
jgi:hypothetical protein